jgi:hypothetical protein
MATDRSGYVDLTDEGQPKLTRRSFYTRADALTRFLETVRTQYHAREGAVPQHTIIAALLNIAAAHVDELPERLEAQLRLDAAARTQRGKEN